MVKPGLHIVVTIRQYACDRVLKRVSKLSKYRLQKVIVVFRPVISIRKHLGSISNLFFLCSPASKMAMFLYLLEFSKIRRDARDKYPYKSHQRIIPIGSHEGNKIFDRGHVTDIVHHCTKQSIGPFCGPCSLAICVNAIAHNLCNKNLTSKGVHNETFLKTVDEVYKGDAVTDQNIKRISKVKDILDDNDPELYNGIILSVLEEMAIAVGLKTKRYHALDDKMFAVIPVDGQGSFIKMTYDNTKYPKSWKTSALEHSISNHEEHIPNINVVTSVGGLRKILVDSLSQPNTHIIANIQMSVLGQRRGGHYSPLGGYDKVSDRFLLLDTNRRYPPAWVTTGCLFNAMATYDDSAKFCRGFLIVQP